MDNKKCPKCNREYMCYRNGWGAYKVYLLLGYGDKILQPDNKVKVSKKGIEFYCICSNILYWDFDD